MIDTKRMLKALELYAQCVPPGATNGHPIDDLYDEILRSAQTLVRHSDEFRTLDSITYLIEIIYLAATAFEGLHSD